MAEIDLCDSRCQQTIPPVSSPLSAGAILEKGLLCLFGFFSDQMPFAFRLSAVDHCRYYIKVRVCSKSTHIFNGLSFLLQNINKNGLYLCIL